MNLVHSFQIKPTWRLVPNSTSTKENKKSFAPGSEIPTSQHDVFDFRSWLKVEFLNHDVRLQVSSLLIFFLACPLRLVQNSVVLLCCTMQKRSLQQMPWCRLFRRDMFEQYVLRTRASTPQGEESSILYDTPSHAVSRNRPRPTSQPALNRA